jgi:hypothetical protein
MVQEGGVPKGPAGLENHGRDKARCGVKKRKMSGGRRQVIPQMLLSARFVYIDQQLIHCLLGDASVISQNGLHMDVKLE